jgi:RES domain-containing protein
VRLWRLARLRFAPTPRDAYSGEGSARRGGRWNSRGVYVAYASSSRALAILEYLAHIDRGMVPDDLALFGVRIPEDAAKRITLDTLPEDWNRIPPPSALAAIGDAWVRSRRSLALEAPSVVAPGDYNVLINPGHPSFHAIVFDDPEELRLDERILGG